jgi:hypothetical protein
LIGFSRDLAFAWGLMARRVLFIVAKWGQDAERTKTAHTSQNQTNIAVAAALGRHPRYSRRIVGGN